MKYKIDTFNKIIVIRKNDKVGVLYEHELFNHSSTVVVCLGKRILFTLTEKEIKFLRNKYREEMGVYVC